MVKKILLILSVVLLCVTVVSADITPQDNFNGRNWFNITNFDFIDSNSFNGTSANFLGNITASWFLGSINWSNIQNKFITAVDNVYLYMSGTTLTLNETKLNQTYVVNSGGDELSGTYDFNGGWSSNGLSIINGDIYAQTGYFYNITGLDVSTLKINGSLLPMTGFNNQFDIGSSSLKWRDLYLGRNLNLSGQFYLPNINVGVDNSVLIQDSDGSIRIDEIDSRVWATSLVDKTGFTIANQIAFFSDSNTITGENDLYWNNTNKRLGIGTNKPTAGVDINSTTFRLRIPRTPSSPEDSCNQGDIFWDANYVYVCIATNSIRRASMSEW